MSRFKNVALLLCAIFSTAALIALVVFQCLSWSASHDERRYEYKVLTLMSEGHDRTGEAAMKFTSITPNEGELSKLGSQGWVIVASYLEMETAYPNFGKAEYVTGLQPNIRPQRVVLILRHEQI